MMQGMCNAAGENIFESVSILCAAVRRWDEARRIAHSTSTKETP
jgi:hypothetical protein